MSVVAVPAGATPAQRFERRLALGTILLPLLGTALALLLAVVAGVRVFDLALAATGYGLTMLGITAGYHRHFTHRSFQARPVVRLVLGGLGAAAAQGPLLYWAAAHRRHHQHADRPGDPHSPWAPPAAGAEQVPGFAHAHLTWMLAPAGEDWVRVVPDLLKDPLAFRLHRHYGGWVLAGLALPAALGALAGGGWAGALTGFLWGGPVRMCLVHHATWLVNSWCHMHGARPHATPDRSTNAWWCAWLTLGEGWHNNHHAAPAAARHGRAWWELDLTYGAIAGLARLGLVSQVVGAAASSATASPESEPA